MRVKVKRVYVLKLQIGNSRVHGALSDEWGIRWLGVLNFVQFDS